ncbi:MAG: hypothetical protein IIC28_11135 [Chloroflexi bacterium]|nr:hypothetical protein [Chloroflexota bacterium]
MITAVSSSTEGDGDHGSDERTGLRRVINQAPIRSLLAWLVVQDGHPGIESTDHVEGIAPVQLRVRLDPKLPGKIIAVQLKDQILDVLKGGRDAKERS